MFQKILHTGAGVLKVGVTNKFSFAERIRSFRLRNLSRFRKDVRSHFRYHDHSSTPFLDSSSVPVSDLHLRRYCLHHPHHPVSYSMVFYLMRAHRMRCCNSALRKYPTTCRVPSITNCTSRISHISITRDHPHSPKPNALAFPSSAQPGNVHARLQDSAASE
jgi:hypothetical protein